MILLKNSVGFTFQEAYFYELVKRMPFFQLNWTKIEGLDWLLQKFLRMGILLLFQRKRKKSSYITSVLTFWRIHWGSRFRKLSCWYNHLLLVQFWQKKTEKIKWLNWLLQKFPRTETLFSFHKKNLSSQKFVKEMKKSSSCTCQWFFWRIQWGSRFKKLSCWYNHLILVQFWQKKLKK